MLFCLPIGLPAQQTRTSLVAVGQDRQKSTFFLADYPRLTITTNGVPTITVRDTKNNSRTNVKTCILCAAPLSPNIVLQENKTTEVHGDGSIPSSKYIRNGILYIRFNGKTYNAQGQRIDLFGWGTGANPTKNSADYNDYCSIHRSFQPSERIVG